MHAVRCMQQVSKRLQNHRLWSAWHSWTEVCHWKHRQEIELAFRDSQGALQGVLQQKTLALMCRGVSRWQHQRLSRAWSRFCFASEVRRSHDIHSRAIDGLQDALKKKTMALLCRGYSRWQHAEMARAWSSWKHTKAQHQAVISVMRRAVLHL